MVPGCVHFAGANGSFGLVARLPTENLHVALEATDNAFVLDPDGNNAEVVNHNS